MTIPAAPFYNDIISKLPLNTKGRDYVIGDVHGRFDLVDEALKNVKFDYHNDRLICVGDLIDRGADSWRVLGFLKRPYVHAVRGNHEDFLLRIYEIESPPEALIEHFAPNMGLTWWLKVQPNLRDLIIAELRNLPLVIEMDTRRGTVGFLHAEVEIGYNWGEFKTALLYNNESVIHNALWGRKRLTRNFDVPIDGIDRVYVGHTVQPKIRQLGNIVGVDTGAVYNQHLTIANVDISSKAIDNMTIPLGSVQVVENDSIVLTPFSHSHKVLEKIQASMIIKAKAQDMKDMKNIKNMNAANINTTNMHTNGTIISNIANIDNADNSDIAAFKAHDEEFNKAEEQNKEAELHAKKVVAQINAKEATSPPKLPIVAKSGKHVVDPVSPLAKKILKTQKAKKTPVATKPQSVDTSHKVDKVDNPTLTLNIGTTTKTIDSERVSNFASSHFTPGALPPLRLVDIPGTLPSRAKAVVQPLKNQAQNAKLVGSTPTNISATKIGNSNIPIPNILTMSNVSPHKENLNDNLDNSDPHNSTSKKRQV